MDLTYMPGELDLKNENKSSDSGLKREHDSVDDFEHLDPSPVDGHSKDFSTFDNKHAVSSDMLIGKEQDASNKLLEDISHDELHLVDKTTDVFPDNITQSSKDLKSDFESDLQRIKSKVGLTNEESSLLDFGIGNDISPSPSDGPKSELSTSTLKKNDIDSKIESHEDKTENESDLLNLGHKIESDDKYVEDKPHTDDFNTLMSGDNTNEEINVDIVKSMKEADALSQYEIKLEKKDIEKKDPLLEDSIQSSFKLASQDHEPELVETSSPGQLSKNSNEELIETKLEPFKEQDDVLEEFDDLPSKEDNPLKHYIAVCPPKPPSTSDTVKKPSISDLDDIIGPEDVFKRIGLDAWFTPDRLHPRVEALVYWRDPKKSGVVFGSIMAILLSLCYMSLISVVAFSSMLVLIGTMCFRIYKNILQAVQKTSEGHPFKELLDLELSLPQDKVREIVDIAVVHINASIVELRRLFLVEDLIDSIKFGLFLWCLTYVGAIFNGMTLVILAFVALFTVPKIYENNKTSIDTYIDLGRSKVAEITSKVKAAVPIGKKEPEKDKEQ